MKVSLKQIADSFSVLLELNSLKLRFKLKYKLGRIYTECEREMKRFKNEHLELIKRFGGVETRPEYWEVPKENLSEFQPEYDELADLEVEIWGDPISPAEFEAAETLHCEKCGVIVERASPEIKGDLSKLFWLIRDSDESDGAISDDESAIERTSAPVN